MSESNLSRSIFVLSAILALQAGCSGGGSGAASGSPGPMSMSQKDRFETTIQNVGYVSEWAVPSSGGSKAPSQPLPTQPQPAPFLAPSLPPESVKQGLDNKVGDPQFCEIKVVQPVQAPAPSPGPVLGTTTEHFGMTVGGARCPIAFNFDGVNNTNRPTPDSASFDSVFSLNYQALSEEARALDITQIGFKVSMNGSIQAPNGRWTLSGDGQILSQKEGTIRLQFSGSADIVNGTTNSISSLRIIYPDGLIVEIKEVSSQPSTGGGTSQYFLNGELITQAEFDRYSKALGLKNAERTSTETSKQPTVRR